MASLRERVQNVFDNHQDFERERVRRDGYRQGLYQARDALLGSALALKEEWASELARSRSESHGSVHARYEARIQGLNDAFSVLRQSEPGITTQLNPDELRDSATRQAKSRNDLEYDRTHSPYQLAYAVTRDQLDARFAQRGTNEEKEHFIRDVGAVANRHLITPYPSDDREAGIRQATVDWANRHDERRLRARGAERSVLNHEPYEAGYAYMKQTLGRTLEAWHHSTGLTPSKEMEREAIHDIAVRASHNVRENWGDRGRGPERLEDPDFDRGSRKALMDWSHEHNRRLAEEQQRVMRNERSREVHEYGVSY